MDNPATPPPDSDSGDGTGDVAEPHRAAITRMSRWQKVVGILGLIVILWVGNQIAGQLTGRGPGPGGIDHGPDRDAPPAEMQDREVDPEDEGGHRPPPGGRGH